MNIWIKWLPIKENKFLNLNLKFDISWISFTTDNIILIILKIFIFKRYVWTISFLAYPCHELLVFSPIPVIIIFWIKYLSVTWYTTCGTCTVFWLYKGFLHILSMYVPPRVCKGLIKMYTPLFYFLTLPQPTPLSKPVSAPSICTCSVNDTALRWLEQHISPHIYTMYPYAQLYNIFTIRGDMSLINP